MTHPEAQAHKAEAFRALHGMGHILVLPNVWDVAGARVFEDFGFPAVATSSAAVAASLGYPDGEKIPKKELFDVVTRIVRTVRIPVSVDLESGYGATVAELEDTIVRLIDAGAVGLNLEDTSQTVPHSLLPVDEQVARLRAVRKVADAEGVRLVVNARTDAFSEGTGDESKRFEEAILRARAYESAGPDCLYPMGLADPRRIAEFVRAVHLPVNVMVRKGTPSVAELESIGVRRLSLGPSAMYATVGLLKRVARELREKGTYECLTSGAVGFDELMALAVPKEQ